MTAILLALQLLLPDHVFTPGAVTPLTMPQVCAIHWGADQRHVTEAMKSQVAWNYDLERSEIVAKGHGPCCEFDHLIPREIGGADAVENLWPQQWPIAVMKDRLENYLHREVCHGRIPLADAQRDISTNWVSAYWRMKWAKWRIR